MVTCEQRPRRDPHAGALARNAAVLAATVVAVAALVLYPTSTDRLTAARRGALPAAPPGIVGAPPTPDAAPTVQSTTPAASPDAAVPSPSAAAQPPPTAPATAPAGIQVVNGASIDTRYGPVQVQIRVQAGRILSASAIDYPQGSGRDREINSYAVPALNRETIAAQSAQIDTVSGATFTSAGYIGSLQSALDAAHVR
jgi:uncharacterized protein with FMN-binding domain